MDSLAQHIKVISCDLDDALYDNRPVLAHAEQTCLDYLQTEFKQQSCPFDPRQFHAIRKRLLTAGDIQLENMNQFRRTALSEFCQALTHRDSIVENALQVFLQARSLATIEPEIEAMMETLSRRYTLVSVTNGNCDPNRLSIGAFFKRNYSPLDGYRAKPHPQMLAQVLEDFSIDPNQLLHIGDSPEKDGAAAESVGAHYCQFAPFETGQSVNDAVNNLMVRLAGS